MQNSLDWKIDRHAIEEQDRSLSEAEVPLPVMEQDTDQSSNTALSLLSEEEMPTVSQTSVESITSRSLEGNDIGQKWSVRDYSRVESKVKMYIADVKEQQRHRRHQHRQYQHERHSSSAIPAPSRERELQRQLDEKDVHVAVLHDEYQTLLLRNAKLKNLVDELRSRAGLASHAAVIRRTNSPPSAATIQNGQLKSKSLSVHHPVDGAVTPARATADSLTLSHYQNVPARSPTHVIDHQSAANQDRVAISSSSSSSSSSWSSLAHVNDQMRSTNQSSGARWAEQPPTDQPSQLKNDDKCALTADQRGYLTSRIQETVLMALVVKKQSCALIHQMKLERP